MSANSSTAEATASEVIDLNADAAAVENQEPSVAVVAEEPETNSAEEVIKEASVGSGAPLNEGLEGEGTGVRDGGERDVNFLVAGSTAEAASEDVLDPGGDVVEGQSVAVDICDRSYLTKEAKKNQSTDNEAVGHGSFDAHVEATEGYPTHGDEGQNQGEAAAGIERGTEDKAEAPSSATKQGMEPDVVGGSAGADIGSLQKGDRGGDQEAYGRNLDLPEGGDVVPSVEEQNMNPEPAVEKSTDRGDVLAPDLNKVMGVTVEVTLAVEVQNMNGQPVDEKPVGMGDVIAGDSKTVMGISVVEAECDDTHLVDETPVCQEDAVIVDSFPVAEATTAVTSQPSEDENIGSEALPSNVGCSSSQVEVSAGLLFAESRKMEAQQVDTHLVDENPVSEGDVVMGDSGVVEEVVIGDSDGGDVLVPDLNKVMGVMVEATPADEVQNMNRQPVDEKPVDMGDVIMGDSKSVMGISVVEADCDDTHLVDETPVCQGDAVIVDSVPVAEATTAVTSQPSEDQNIGSEALPSSVGRGSSQVEVSGGSLFVESQKMEAQQENTHLVDENPVGEGDVVDDSGLVEEVVIGDSDGGDVLAPDLNIVMGVMVEATPVVEVQNMNRQPIDEKPVDMGDVITGDLKSVMGTSVVEAECDDTHLVDETPVCQGDAVIMDSVPVAEATTVVTSQPSEDENIGSEALPSNVGCSSSQVEVSAGLLFAESRKMETQQVDTHLVDENPVGEGDVVVDDSGLVEEVVIGDSDGGDVLAPDLNIVIGLMVEATPAVEVQNMNQQSVDEKPVHMGAVIAGDSKSVMGISVVKTECVDTHLVDETPVCQGDVIVDSVPVAEATTVVTSQPYEVQNIGSEVLPSNVGCSSSQVEVSAGLLFVESQKMEVQLEDTHRVVENPVGGGDVFMGDSDLVEEVGLPKAPRTSEYQSSGSQASSSEGEDDASQVKLPAGSLLDENQTAEAQIEVIHLVDGNPTGNNELVMANSQSIAEASLPESSQPSVDQNVGSQAQPSEVEYGSSQSTEAQCVGSVPDEDPDSSPSVMVGLDTYPNGSKNLTTESEDVKTHLSPPEEPHGQEVNVDKKEVDEVISVPGDSMENDVTEANTDEDRKAEVNVVELLKEAEKPTGNNAIIRPDTVDAVNEQCACYFLPQEEKLVKAPQTSVDQCGGSQAPYSEDEHNASQVKLSAGSLLDVNQKTEAQIEVIHLVDGNPTGNNDLVMADSNSIAEASLPETSQPSEDQNVGSHAQPSEVEYGPSQVEVSFGPSLVENQCTEAQLVGSVPDEDQDSPPSALVGLDTYPTGGKNMATESEDVKTDLSPPEEAHGQEVKVDKKEVDEVISVPGDSMENVVTEANTDGDQKVEVKAAELLKKAEKPTVKRAIIRSDTVEAENEQHACYFLPQEEKLVKAPQTSADQSDGSQAPSSGGEHDASQVKLSAGSLLDENQKAEAQIEAAHLVGVPTGNNDLVMADSNSIAEATLQETSQPSEDQNVASQALPSEVEYGSSQVEISFGPSLVENQSTEAQLVGSLPDEDQESLPSVLVGLDTNPNRGKYMATVSEDVKTDLSPPEEAQDSPPSVLVGLDTSPNGGKNMATESEDVKTDSSPPEEAYGPEVKVDIKEVDEVIYVPGDSMENAVTEANTDGDQKAEVKAAELLEKEEKPTVKRAIIRPGTVDTENEQHACYFLPQEEKSVFSIFDLVWGKVKSHPWWPGQIFDPLDASEMALKHQRKDNFLVAYFGDKTFAWCEESQLKPFQTCFSQMEKQSTSDAFVNSVNSALCEVSRCVELGMLCFCVPEQSSNNLKYQKIENAGIREGASSLVLEKSLGAISFQPDRFLEYIQALAQFPCGGADRLELTIAEGQLMAFNRSKGYTDLPAFYVGGLLDNDVISCSERKRPPKALIEDPTPVSMDEEKRPTDLISGKGKHKAGGSMLHRQKHILEDGRKQKSLSELMEDKKDSDFVNCGGSGSETKTSGKSFPQYSGKKHKGIDPISADSVKSKKKRLDDLGDLETKSPSPVLNRSFMVGECIRRVARKLTGSPPIVRCNGGSFNKSAGKADLDCLGFDSSLQTPEDTQRMKTRKSKYYSSPDEMLSQLCLAARDPMKGFSFLSTIISFFTDIRKLRDSSSATDKKPLKEIRGKRGRKKSSEKTDFSETSTPDYMKDSYWTDGIYSSSGGKLISNGRKRKGESKTLNPTKKTKPTKEPLESLPLSKMLETAHHLRISAASPTANRDLAVVKQVNFFGEKSVEESTPTALILSFTESDVLPSETDLIRIFSRYGPLKEAETEVLKKTNHAKVVFKRRADAEVAFSSAGKYCIFGPALVSYRLRYLPSTPKPSTPKLSHNATPDGKKDEATMDGGNLEIPA